MKNSATRLFSLVCHGWLFRNLVSLSLISVMLVFTHDAYSQGLLGKMAAKMAKKVGGVNTVSVAALDDVVPTISIEGNLYPAELGTISQSFYEGWKTGGDIVGMSFFSKGTTSFVKIDGTVTINGQPVEYAAAGSYGLITSPSDAPRKVEITTSTGQKSSFTLMPSSQQVKILSVNGQKDKISLDLTKDVVLELEGKGISESTLMRVNIAINQVGIKSFYGVCYVKYGSRVTIPAAAFRNINIKPAGEAMYNYKKSFLGVAIETAQEATAVSGAFPKISYTSAYTDGKFINVSEEPNLNKGLVAKGKNDFKEGEVNYDLGKPNAFSSRPSAMIKKIGLLSFVVAGKTIGGESVIEQEENIPKGEAKITRTTTITFPAQTNETWDAMLAKIYPQLMTIVKSELGAEVLPAEAVLKTGTYQSIKSFSKAELNNEGEVLRGYAQTKLLQGIPAGQGLGVNGPNEKMLNESGADALMNITLGLEVQQDKDFGILVPTLTFEIIGKSNGRETETKYYTGTVTGKGIHSTDIGLKIEFYSYIAPMSDMKGRNDSKVYHNVGKITPEELDRLVRWSDLLTTFGKALKEIKEKEKANGDYEVVWDLQK
ncbi:MAG: hypothetical protein SH819_01245 [Cytophagales bacterium]|nr:hypothetical protein [Cytophagales bacterium]